MDLIKIHWVDIGFFSEYWRILVTIFLFFRHNIFFLAGDPGRTCSAEWKTKVWSLLKYKNWKSATPKTFYEEKKYQQKKPGF